MDISVLGLGYVGCVSAACLAEQGHSVIGVDIDPSKVEAVKNGESPIVEPGLSDLLGKAAAKGKISATQSVHEAIAGSEISIVCVGTPSRINGSLDTSVVQKVCREIGTALSTNGAGHTVCIRSTILPGTMAGVIRPLLEELSGKTVGKDLGLVNNPEFLRESTAIKDYFQPPKIVIGSLTESDADRAARIYEGIQAPLFRTDFETAELVKYADNAWHALKVAFGNEIGNIAKSAGIDGRKAMDIFCQDTKLNISPAYLRPGFAFGGSCLPKDLRAITYYARAKDLQLPVLNAVMPSNSIQIERGIQRILACNGKRIGMLGLSFKSGTDDLRESPLVEVAERLLGKGFELRIFDANVRVSALTGANKKAIDAAIGHLSSLMVDDIEELVRNSDVVVVGNNDTRFGAVLEKLQPGQSLVDFVGIDSNGHVPAGYDGINW